MAEIIGISVTAQLVTAVITDNYGKPISRHMVELPNNDDKTVVQAIQAILNVLKKQPSNISIVCPRESQQWTLQSALEKLSIKWRDITTFVDLPQAMTQFIWSEPRLYKYTTVAMVNMAQAGKVEEGDSLVVVRVADRNLPPQEAASGVKYVNPTVELESEHVAGQFATRICAKNIAQSLNTLIGAEAKPDLLLVCGTGALDMETIDFLEQETHIPVYSAPEPKYTVAAGSALKKAVSGQQKEPISGWIVALLSTLGILLCIGIFVGILYLLLSNNKVPIVEPSSTSRSSHATRPSTHTPPRTSTSIPSRKSYVPPPPQPPSAHVPDAPGPAPAPSADNPPEKKEPSGPPRFTNINNGSGQKDNVYGPEYTAPKPVPSQGPHTIPQE